MSNVLNDSGINSKLPQIQEIKFSLVCVGGLMVECLFIIITAYFEYFFEFVFGRKYFS